MIQPPIPANDTRDTFEVAASKLRAEATIMGWCNSLIARQVERTISRDSVAANNRPETDNGNR